MALVVGLPDRRHAAARATPSRSSQTVIDEEIAKLQHEPPSAHEVERSVNQIEASFYNRMERLGGFGGKADQMNAYFSKTGDPD